MKPGAGLLIFRPDGHAFLVRRSKEVRHPGEWDLPGGGIEPGETALEAAVREGNEEAGSLPALSVFGSYIDGTYSTFLASIDQVEADLWTPYPGPEVDQHGWFDPGKPPHPLRPNVQSVFRAITA